MLDSRGFGKTLRAVLEKTKNVKKSQETVVLWSNSSCIIQEGQKFESHHRQKNFKIFPFYRAMINHYFRIAVFIINHVRFLAWFVM